MKRKEVENVGGERKGRLNVSTVNGSSIRDLGECWTTCDYSMCRIACGAHHEDRTSR